MNDLDAKLLVDEALPEFTESERQFLRAVARFETNYSRGWKTPEGRAANNWGAVTDPNCGPLSFRNQDSRPTEHGQETYVTCFAGYPTPHDGIRGMARVLLKPNVRAALPDWMAAARAMRANSYFLGHSLDPEVAAREYGERLISLGKSIANSTGERLRFSGGKSWIILVLGGLGLAGAAGWATMKRRATR